MSDKIDHGASVTPIKPGLVYTSAGDMPDEDRQQELYEMVRAHLAQHIRVELEGGEHIMKEVWEETTSDAERVLVKETLQEVLDFLDDGEDGA